MPLLRRATKLLSPLIFATILASSLAVAAAPKSNQKTDNAKSARQKEAEPSVLQGIHVLGDRPAPFALDAHAALLVAAHSGAVLYAYNEHMKMQPASLAKIMTFYISLEALKNGKITLDTPIPISEKAWRLSIDKTVSKMFLEVGQQVAVKDLFYGLMVSSGNDAATALAEYLAGSTDAFVTMMNDQAKALGLKESHFSSPDGLPEPNQYTTAFDMVKLARMVIERHPEAFNYTAVKQYTFHNIEQRN